MAEWVEERKGAEKEEGNFLRKKWIGSFGLFDLISGVGPT